MSKEGNREVAMEGGGPRRRGGGPLTGTVVTTTDRSSGTKRPTRGSLPQSGGVSVGATWEGQPVLRPYMITNVAIGEPIHGGSPRLGSRE